MNINTLYENFYKRKENARLINEVMKFLVVEGDSSTPTSEQFDWNAIPELPISELGWSDTRTRDIGGAQGGQRKLLEDYLNQIQGGDLPTKLKNLNEFMVNPDLESNSPGDKIAKILGYLVFYKTLTRVITNFNASSAGFSFESFLAVLTGGTQIETGGETIADYITQGGDYVSLKLYNEASVDVAGSFQDLVDDLADDTKNNRMTYLVVLKNLDGEGLDQEGTLSFYEFTLTLDNIGYFIDKSSKDSRAMMALPLRDGQLIDLDAPEPETAELEEATQRVRASSEAYQENFNEVMNSEAANFISSMIERFPEITSMADELSFIMQGIQLGTPNFPKLTEGAISEAARYIKEKIKEIGADPEKAEILNAQVPSPTGAGSRWRVHKYLTAGLTQAIKDTHRQLKKEPEAGRQSGAQSLLKNIRLNKKSITDSIEYYGSLKGNPEMQKKALFSSYGYLAAKKFGVGKKVATGGSAVIDMPVEDFGVLEIGASRIVPILEQARGELNDQVFGIFKNLKTLSTEINAYFASGLQDEKAGAEASQASKNIATSTEEITTQKK